MAPTSRNEDPTVGGATASPEIEASLGKEPFAFDFFQAVRMLSRLLPDRQPVGRFSDPKSEVVRFATSAELGFPPSQIADLEWPESSQPRMQVNFMGLTGPHGVLPLYYSALIRERLRVRDKALHAFLDLFNHRIISLFYQAWEKHHFTVGYERNESDPISPHLMDLLGLGTPHLASRQAVPDEALLFRCGLLGAHSRSAAALRALLIDYFEVPVDIEQFVGKWYPIDETTRCRFSDSGSDSERLGLGTVVGDEIWDQQSGVRIKLGPLTLQQYLEFLPEGRAHQPLRSLVRFFAGNELDFEVQLILRKEEIPSCELGADGPSAPRLGWLTWAKTEPPAQDADESVLTI
jgi:type VI secretion system protein ImpH